MRRGTRVSGLKEMMTEDALIDKNTGMQKHLTGHKHTKKDYDRLKSISVNELVAKTKEERVSKRFEDESIDGIMKVEKKKTFKKKKRQEVKEKEEEIQRLLESPQDINYDKAMQMYEEQPLEAKEITQKDKQRLRRLKRKAEKEIKVAEAV